MVGPHGGQQRRPTGDLLGQQAAELVAPIGVVAEREQLLQLVDHEDGPRAGLRSVGIQDVDLERAADGPDRRQE